MTYMTNDLCEAWPMWPMTLIGRKHFFLFKCELDCKGRMSVNNDWISTSKDIFKTEYLSVLWNPELEEDLESGSRIVFQNRSRIVGTVKFGVLELKLESCWNSVFSISLNVYINVSRFSIIGIGYWIGIGNPKQVKIGRV